MLGKGEKPFHFRRLASSSQNPPLQPILPSVPAVSGASHWIGTPSAPSVYPSPYPNQPSSFQTPYSNIPSYPSPYLANNSNPAPLSLLPDPLPSPPPPPTPQLCLPLITKANVVKIVAKCLPPGSNELSLLRMFQRVSRIVNVSLRNDTAYMVC